MVNFDIFLFSLFSFLGVTSAFFVVSLRNAVHSVLFLVLTFFNFACLLLLLGAEFFSFLLIIVYVGAIAVLFLFVIMMLNIKLEISLSNLHIILPLILITIFFFFNIFSSVFNSSDLLRFCIYNLEWISWFNEKNVETNTFVIGKVLYSYFSFLFISASFVLLVAMIGAIVLTMHYKLSSKAQVVEIQLIRSARDSVKFIKLRK
uniref:NADH dehydrogenase subunit 6 n=1 Tax=Campylaephora sungminbooi TaxID=1896769 RepID=UPI002E78FAF4|nr:NADH dehydrogenase subunit 6 [Campylaephora sungminbooi]WQF69653.1 NADH dehydrogenase subunit 6 [Campylaephora sungminbooi]